MNGAGITITIERYQWVGRKVYPHHASTLFQALLGVVPPRGDWRLAKQSGNISPDERHRADTACRHKASHEERAPRCGAARIVHDTTEYGITAMHGKSSKYASTVLSALLYAQGLFGLAGVTLVVVKDRIQVDSVIAMNAASQDAEVR
jgi:hypothetical protein